MKKLLMFILIFTLGCYDKPSHNLVSKEEFKSYLNYKKDDWCEKCKCENKLIKKIVFDLKLEFIFDFSNIEYEFLIIKQGIIYRGQFESKIIVNDICFCLDDDLTKLNTLAFVFLDKTNKTAYKWYNKDSYKLYKENNLKIVLLNDGNYKISL